MNLICVSKHNIIIHLESGSQPPDEYKSNIHFFLANSLRKIWSSLAAKSSIMFTSWKGH